MRSRFYGEQTFVKRIFAKLVFAKPTYAKRAFLKADLREADLSEADLREADLSGADMRKTKLDKANFDYKVIKILTDPFTFKTEEIVESNDLVFVIMPFTANWSDRIWKKHICPTVNSIQPLVCQRADDLSGTDVLADTIKYIAKAKIVIADITGQNPNVFYELGIAHALGKRTILITQRAKDIPVDLLRFRHIIYSDNSEGCEKLEKSLKKYIDDILKEEKYMPNLE